MASLRLWLLGFLLGEGGGARRGNKLFMFGDFCESLFGGGEIS